MDVNVKHGVWGFAFEVNMGLILHGARFRPSTVGTVIMALRRYLVFGHFDSSEAAPL